jgi:hypothetical protein
MRNFSELILCSTILSMPWAHHPIRQINRLEELEKWCPMEECQWWWAERAEKTENWCPWKVSFLEVCFWPVTIFCEWIEFSSNS